MKVAITSLLFCLVASFGLAQSPYAGGNGGGYAMTNWKVPLVLESEVQLFPTQVAPGNQIQILAQDLKNKLDIRIVDLLGHEIWRNVEFGLQGEQVRYLVVPSISQGIYLVDVRRDGRQKVFQIKVIE